MSTKEEMEVAGREAAEQLKDTAGNLRDVATPEQINDANFCMALDDVIFECELCGWWCSNDEDKGSGICEDCHNDDDEDGDDEDDAE